MKIIYRLLLPLLVILPLEAKETRDGRTVINLAGKQRMLTQKMSKEALLIISGIEAEKNKKILQQTISTFDITLKGLRDGNKALHLPKTQEKEIVALLNKEIKLWNLFKRFLNKIVDGKADKETLKAVEIANMPLLTLTNKVVHLYEKKYVSTLSADIVKTINLAGRERMLIQKMTKELLLIATNIKSDAYIKSLETDGHLFQVKLDELIKDKKRIKEPKLAQRVTDIKKLWDEYQGIIANTELSTKGVKIFNEREKKIVDKMSKEMMVVAKLIDAQRYQINLAQTEMLFDTTLTALIKGDSKLGITATSNKEIQQQLQKVKKLWKEYQPIIKNVDTSKQGLIKAMEINIPLLKEMDKAVKLYELN
ncbi:MAG: type IV pili methyl-accepting chemotaxis transducer N-terminal domain-containing protein [Sulfurovaceae bacterium]|nr:type IV pili methyl-accepting chemotaxis transducer N-terminal domain-containing protein [Sulfurovaceae bacterium]